MKLPEFDPKAGSLQLSFSDGTSYSMDLKKTYHREENFYVDLFWEEKGSATSLSLALHPKADDLVLSSCKLSWPLETGFPREVLTQGFIHSKPRQWQRLRSVAPAPGFWKNLALEKLNFYDPLPPASLMLASYQSIGLRDKHRTIEIKSLDESAALTVFTLPQNEHCLYAENQSEGYQLRHSFPAFELQFDTQKPRVASFNRESSPSIFSLAVSPSWIQEANFLKLTKSSLVEEGNLRSIVLRGHDNPSPGNTGFDESHLSAFAKTCTQINTLAGVELSPFVVAANSSSAGIRSIKTSRFKRWSPSLAGWIYPLDLSDEETMRNCEQHLLRFLQLGYRYFILQDVALSLQEGLASTTTGQQLNQRLDLIRRMLPDATILLGDLCTSDAHIRFDGYQTTETQKRKLPRFARFAGLGMAQQDFGKLASFRIPIIEFEPSQDATPIPQKLLDLSSCALGSQTLLAIESTVGSENYPKT